MRKSFNIFAAVTVTALAFSLVGQPVEAATFTWRTTSGTGNAQLYSNAGNWIGNVAPLASGTTTNTLVFTSVTGSSSLTTNPGSNFGVNQLQVDGTTSYVQGSSLSFADGGSLVNTSSVPQSFSSVRANGSGFSVTSTSGTLTLAATTGSGTITFNGAGQKVLSNATIGTIGVGITNDGGPLTVPSNVFTQATVTGDMNLNAGTLTVGTTLPSSLLTTGNFNGASGATLSGIASFDATVISAFGDINYGGVALNLDLNQMADTVSTPFGDPAAYPFSINGPGSFNGNIGSLVTSATSGPFVGLAWSQVGQNWLSSTYNTNQQLEFRPADGGIYVVPEPTQMVFVAGVAAAFGAWRMRKLRRNARGSDATAC